jgi:hypothetical protein
MMELEFEGKRRASARKKATKYVSGARHTHEDEATSGMRQLFYFARRAAAPGPVTKSLRPRTGKRAYIQRAFRGGRATSRRRVLSV